jgi:hypothetical protein
VDFHIVEKIGSSSSFIGKQKIFMVNLCLDPNDESASVMIGLANLESTFISGDSCLKLRNYI